MPWWWLQWSALFDLAQGQLGQPDDGIQVQWCWWWFFLCGDCAQGKHCQLCRLWRFWWRFWWREGTRSILPWRSWRSFELGRCFYEQHYLSIQLQYYFLDLYLVQVGQQLDHVNLERTKPQQDA